MMAGGDENFILKMIRLFIQQTPEMIKKLNKALEEGDLKQTKLIAHKMISSIDMMGIESIRQEIRDLERSAAKNGSIEVIRSYVENIGKVLTLTLEQVKNDHKL